MKQGLITATAVIKILVLYQTVVRRNAQFFYNHVHNILRLSDDLAIFSFTTSETKRHY